MSDSELPANVQDEYAKVKIGLAATAVLVTGGVSTAAALGLIATTDIVKEIETAFIALIGVSVGFFFGKKSQ